MFINIFSKITLREIIHSKVNNNEPGLYLYLVLPIAVMFLLTFISARIISNLAPQFFLVTERGIHIHHFTYGFFILAISGYLALIYNGPRAKYFISLLFGIGLGLAFDEFGMWLQLKDNDPARWNYDGFLIIIGSFFMIVSLKPGIKTLKLLWPFQRKTQNTKTF